MKQNFVSLHPYFKAHSGKIDEIKAGFARFVKETATEEDVLFYGFTANADEFFCREAYGSADGLLAHLKNVETLLAELLKIADLTRIEIHGPASELEKLRAPLTYLNPVYFTLEAKYCGSEPD